MQFASWGLVLTFRAIACLARVTKFVDLVLEPGPPVPTADVLCRLQGTKVPYYRMGLLYDATMQGRILGR